MKVLKIGFDHFNFVTATYYADNSARSELQRNLWGRESLLSSWDKISMSVVDGNLPWGHFFGIHIGGILGVTVEALEHDGVRNILEASGELLPVVVGGVDCFLFHGKIIDGLLNTEASTMRQLENGNWVISKPVFSAENLSNINGLFRISGMVRLFAQSGFAGSFDDFYKYGDMKGLKFDEMEVL